MHANTLAKKALSVEYQLMRTPLHVIAHRVRPTSRLRAPLERRLAVMDAAAGRLLDDDVLARRGDEALRDIEKAERTERRLDAVDRRTAARHERIDRQTAKKVDHAETERRKAQSARTGARAKRAEAERLDELADETR